MKKHIRPQRLRERTFDREILQKEHREESDLHERLQEEGKKYEESLSSLEDAYRKIDGNQRLSHRDKEPILSELEESFEAVKKEYLNKVYYLEKEIEDSMRERIQEMEKASDFWKVQTKELEDMDLKTGAVDKEGILDEADVVSRKYTELLKDSRDDLSDLIKKSEELREKIRRRSVR